MSIRQRLSKWLHSLARIAQPQPTQQEIDDRRADVHLRRRILEIARQHEPERNLYMERISELIEARQMAGAGPWRVSESALRDTDRIINEAITARTENRPMKLTEATGGSIVAQGITGDVELNLQNVEWRREVNLAWLEFSRWGIQQLILICRLYYVKHPWIRRGINLSAAYVFGQGVELSSPDDAANEVLKDFRERNKTALGQIALTEAEKRKSYDGNLFWCLFPDTQDTGKTNVRLIDATEIQEIWCDPDDADKPWLYRRVWTQRTPNIMTGEMSNDQSEEWYPALGYKPEVEPAMMGGKPINWKTPIYHRKVGGVANWRFGCPRIYAGIDWAKEGRRMLEACASVTQALSQIAILVMTKGGQQALDGLKQQLGTTVGPTSSIWDQNPPAGAGSTFASGPGTTLQAFKTRGQGTDPSEVKEYRNMAACALEIPPTWLGDMETSNLSTAQTLDRPTELGFLLKQEEWQEDLVVMGRYALEVSLGAPSGKLRESKNEEKVQILEAVRVRTNGHWVYEAAKQKKPDVVEVMATFPAIREGDIPALVKATLDAIALDRLGKTHGIDEKTAVRKFCLLLDVPNVEELLEQLYPEATYERDRNAMLKAEQDAAANAPPPPPAGAPPNAAKEAERIREALKRTERALSTLENGHATHTH